MLNNTFLAELRDRPLSAVANYYASCLDDSRSAMEYLQRDCLMVTPESGLAVGFADRSLGKHIPAKILKAGKLLRGQLETLGIYRSNGREHFRGMVTVPLMTVSGEVTGLYGRRADFRQSKGTEQHVGRGLFNATAIQRFDELIVTDSVLDAWAFFAAGYQHAICAVDCELLIEQLTGVRRIILAGDNIDCEAFTGLELHRLVLPAGMSVHRYCLEHAADRAERLAGLLRSAPWLQGTHEPPSPAIQSHSASPVPLPVDDLVAESANEGDEVTIHIESRRWRVRGLLEAQGLRLNVMVTSTRSERFHLDCFDLVHARSRRTFVTEAAEEIGESESQLRGDLGQVLLKLEQLQHERQQAHAQSASSQRRELSAEEQAAALELLRSDNLLERILHDFEACGVVGERTGKLVGYLAATSRLLDKPLGLVIQSSSAAGKSSLAEAILRLMPPEECLACSAMTSQSLYYLGQQNLRHKILSIAEEEGVRDAAYQLKLLQSEGQLSLVASSKQKGSGRTTTERYEVQGPVALMLTTTSLSIDPELLNRCLVIAVDESPAQTAAIHAQQRLGETLAGMEQRLRQSRIVSQHHSAQRMLRAIHVHNPYAEQLRFIGSQTRHRRDHQKYLTLIKTITLLHQYQRTTKWLDVDGATLEYLEVTRDDIALANRIADWALGRSIDELSAPTRRLLIELYDWVRGEASRERLAVSEYTFTRRQARESLGWNTTHLRIHLEQLVRHELVAPLGRGRGRLHHYSLLYDGRGREGQPSLLGLVDPSSLVEPVDTQLRGNLAQD